MLKFLKKEDVKYRIVTVGSSAGGYAAILYGSLLGAEKIFAFNPQFEINSLLSSSSEKINPILFRNKDNIELRKYYDIVPFISKSPIFYFMSEKSEWDSEQLNHLGNNPTVKIIRFKSSHHGLPFPRVALRFVMITPNDRLSALNRKRYNPIIFSIKFAGIWRTVLGTLLQGISILNKNLNRENK